MVKPVMLKPWGARSSGEVKGFLDFRVSCGAGVPEIVSPGASPGPPATLMFNVAGWGTTRVVVVRPQVIGDYSAKNTKH